MTALGDLDQARIGELHAAELAQFWRAWPRTLAMLGRARGHMPNGTPMAWMTSDNDQPVYIDHGQGPGFTDTAPSWAWMRPIPCRRPWRRGHADSDRVTFIP